MIYEKTCQDFVYDDDEDIKIIFTLLEYAEDHPNFNPEFVEAMEELLYEDGKISGCQYNALVNVYNRFILLK